MEKKEMSALAIQKVIGLEGFTNSGKSHVIKELFKALVGKMGGRVLHVFKWDGSEDKTKTVDLDADIIVIVEVKGKVVMLASGGDYMNIPSVIVQIVLEVSLEIHIYALVVAMRYRYPAVGDEYRQVLKKHGLEVCSVFKPGCKRVAELPDGVLDRADGLWVRRLEEEIGFESL